MSDVTVTMPAELTSDMLRAVAENPTTTTGNMDEMHRRMGWLVCAWGVLITSRRPPITALDHSAATRDSLLYALMNNTELSAVQRSALYSLVEQHMTPNKQAQRPTMAPQK